MMNDELENIGMKKGMETRDFFPIKFTAFLLKYD